MKLPEATCRVKVIVRGSTMGKIGSVNPAIAAYPFTFLRRTMWEPFTNSILSWAPECRIVYDKFPVMQHASRAVDEVRRAEFFRKGGRTRDLVKGKRWLLLSRWGNLDSRKRQLLNELFRLNRRMMKAYLLKESLDRFWTYTYEGAAASYLNR
jgi:transposase